MSSHAHAAPNGRSFRNVMLIMGTLLLSALFALTSALPVEAQESTPAASPAGSPVAADATSQVKIVHASLDAPAVDVYVDGTLAFDALEPATATEFVELPAGEYQVQVTPTGATPEEAVIDTTVTLEGGVAYEVAALGSLDALTAGVFEVDLAPAEDDSSRIRTVHGSSDAGPVDVAVTGGDVVFANAEFPLATDYAEVPAGLYDFEVRPAGTTDVALALPGTELLAGTVYSVYAVGSAAEGTLTALVTAEPTAESTAGTCGTTLGIGSADDACVRVVHGSSDAGPVDIYVNGEAAVQGLEFATATDFLALPAGDAQIQVVPAGQAPDAAVIDTIVPLEAGLAVDIAALGLVEDIQTGIYPVDLSALETEGLTRAVLVHGSPDAGAVDVAVAGADVIFADVTFLESTSALEIDAATLDLEVRPAGTTDVVLELPGVTLEADTVYHLYAIGSAVDGSLTVLILAAPVGG